MQAVRPLRWAGVEGAWCWPAEGQCQQSDGSCTDMYVSPDWAQLSSHQSTVMRKEAVLTTLLNVSLFHGMSCAIAQDPRYVRFSAIDTGAGTQLTHYNLRVSIDFLSMPTLLNVLSSWATLNLRKICSTIYETASQMHDEHKDNAVYKNRLYCIFFSTTYFISYLYLPMNILGRLYSL